MLHLLQDEQARRRAKNNRKKVLCPYCHQHFLLGEVVFRSSKAVDHLFDSKKSVEEDVFYNTWKKRGWIGLGEQQVTDKEHNKDDKKPRFMCEDRRNKCYYEAEAETDNSVRVDNVHFRIIDRDVAEEYVYDKDGYLYGCRESVNGESVLTEERVCPHCYCLLPNDYGKYPTKFVSILGVVGSGKTNYIAQLLGDKDVFAAMGIETIVGAEGECFKKWYAPKIKNGEEGPWVDFAQNTTTEKVYPPLFLSLFRGGDADNRFSLVLCDVAGENCANATDIQARGEFILHSDAIILLISPEQVAHAMRERITFDPVYGIRKQDDLSLGQVFSTINAFADNRRVLKRLWQVPMALTLSKADCYRGVKKGTETESFLPDTFFENVDYDGQTMFHAGAQQQRDGLINEIGAFGTDALRTALEQYKYKKQFAIAVIGEDRITVESLRLEEPFAWFLSHWGWIPAEGESVSRIKSTWTKMKSHFRG